MSLQDITSLQNCKCTTKTLTLDDPLLLICPHCHCVQWTPQLCWLAGQNPVSLASAVCQFLAACTPDCNHDQQHPPQSLDSSSSKNTWQQLMPTMNFILAYYELIPYKNMSCKGIWHQHPSPSPHPPITHPPLSIITSSHHRLTPCGYPSPRAGRSTGPPPGSTSRRARWSPESYQRWSGPGTAGPGPGEAMKGDTKTRVV